MPRGKRGKKGATPGKQGTPKEGNDTDQEGKQGTPKEGNDKDQEGSSTIGGSDDVNDGKGEDGVTSDASHSENQTPRTDPTRKDDERKDDARNDDDDNKQHNACGNTRDAKGKDKDDGARRWQHQGEQRDYEELLERLRYLEERLNHAPPPPPPYAHTRAPFQQPARSGRAKLPEPEVFKGEEGDLRRFITASREYREYYRSTSSEEDLIRILAGRLQGGPSHWSQSEIEAARRAHGELPWKSVEHFLEALQRLFANPNEAFDAYATLATIKASDFTSWNGFLTEMRRLFALIPHPPHLRAHAIVRALPADGVLLPTLGSQELWAEWRADPTRMDENDYNAFLRMVGSAVRSILYRTSAERSPTRKYVPPQGRNDFTSRARGTTQVMGIMAEKRKELGASLFKRLRDEGACFNCHRTDCPYGGALKCKNPSARVNVMSIDVLDALSEAGYPTTEVAVLAALRATPSPEPDVEDTDEHDVDALAAMMRMDAAVTPPASQQA